MRVIDSVKMPGYSQWCSHFVERVVKLADLRIDGKKVDTVKIVYIEDKRIYLSIDKIPFIIRTWDYTPCERDKNGDICGEEVNYTLFLDKEYYVSEGTLSVNGHPLSSGILKIFWSNNPAIYKQEEERYNRMHGLN